MRFALSDVHAVTGGELRGDGRTVLSGIRSLAGAGPTDLSFVRDAQFADAARGSRAGALLVPPLEGIDWGRPVIVHETPHQALIAFLDHLEDARDVPVAEIDPRAAIAESARLGPGVAVGAFAVVGERVTIGAGTRIHPGAVLGADVVLGERCVLHPNVVVYDGCRLGDRVVVHAASVIGADGFGFVPRDGRPKKVPHVGSVVIHDEVEIGANSTIDRGMLEDTVIGKYVKIDDHCHVAHNVVLGEGCLLAGGTQLSGSVRAGRGVVFGGASGASDNLVIGDFARIGGGSSVFEDVPAKASYWGYPARDARETMRVVAAWRKLPELVREVRRLRRGQAPQGSENA